MSSILGLDLGTSSVKLCLLAGTGTVLATAKAEYPMPGTGQGAFEQRPADWSSAIGAALAALAEAAPAAIRTVAAIALSAQMPTLVLAAPDGTPLCNAITWRDTRAERKGAALLELWGKDDYYSRTGIVLDGRYLLPMYKWVLAHGDFDPRQPHRILSAKDWLALWLTGAASTDPSTASGSGAYNLRTATYDAELLAKAGVAPELVPPIVESGAVCGHLTPAAAQALGLAPGIPVVCGAADSVCGVLGTGATTPGAVCQIWGSSTAIIAVTDRPVFSPGQHFFITPLAENGTFGAEADLLATGVALDWVADLFDDVTTALYGKRRADIPVSVISKTAMAAPPGAGGLLFYPYFSGGEQGVLWDSTLRAAVLGISTAHRLPHLLRALLEGMCFEARRCLEAFEAGGCALTGIFCAGSSARDAPFMQLLADITGLAVNALTEGNGSAIGAALLGGIGTGLWAWADIPRLTAGACLRYVPNAALETTYLECYGLYKGFTAQAKFSRAALGL